MKFKAVMTEELPKLISDTKTDAQSEKTKKNAKQNKVHIETTKMPPKWSQKN